MKNCLILGFGRSGTSLMGGILHRSGYYMGDKLYKPRHSNPKGFFENAIINGINEQILEPFDYVNFYPNSHSFNKAYSPFKPRRGQRWLSFIMPDLNIECNDTTILREINHEIKKKKFAYKDPRFVFTLKIWEEYIDDECVFICLFREPTTTINSVLKECRSVDYLADFYIDLDLASVLWKNYYQRVLKYMEKFPKEKFFLIHYDQILQGTGLEQLSEILQTNLNTSFIEVNLNRSRPSNTSKSGLSEIYSKLCEKANYMVYY